MSDFVVIIWVQSVQKRAKRGKAELFRTLLSERKKVFWVGSRNKERI